jgi:hypothetical protein
MSTEDPGDLYSPDPNILERRAASYLARLSRPAAAGPAAPGPIDEGEMRTAARLAIMLAAVAGIVSGGIIGGVEIWIDPGRPDGLDDADWREQLPSWIGYFAIAGVVSAIEIAFLYAVALRGIARVTVGSGLDVGNEGYPGMFARSLARGAFEFPNPRITIFGIDPYAYVGAWSLAVQNIAYKLKVGVSSFILRVFLRRVAARMAIRGFVPLVAGPLYAAWNAFVMWRIMNEARVRALGPRAIHAVLGGLFQDDAVPATRTTDAVLQGTAEMIMRGRDAHANHVLLISRLREELRVTAEVEANWDGQAETLPSLDRKDQERLLDVLTLAAIVGSRVRRHQKHLLRDVCAACGVGFRPRALSDLRKRLVTGGRITRVELAEVRG